MTKAEFKIKVPGKPYSFNSPIYFAAEEVVRIYEEDGGYARVILTGDREHVLWEGAFSVSRFSGVPVECDGEPYKHESPGLFDGTAMLDETGGGTDLL